MRVFLDTNVVISAILFPQGKVALVFSHILEMHEPIISSYSIMECEVLFDRKFPAKKPLLRKFLDTCSFELFITPSRIDPNDYPNIRDIGDLPILASAILSDSDILLTGDKDFEGISLPKPLIFTPSGYYKLIYSRQGG